MVYNELNISSIPVSGLVSKCVRDFDMCLHSASSLEQRVGVRDDLRGKSVPFTCDNSRSGINGSTQNRARSPTGLHHGITTCNHKNNFHNQGERFPSTQHYLSSYKCESTEQHTQIYSKNYRDTVL
jgi:hypothetical protein